jgi:hypothetical protein
MFANFTPIDAFCISCMLMLVFFIFWMGRQITPEDYPPDFSKVTAKVVCTKNGIVLQETIPFSVAYLLDIDSTKESVTIGDCVYRRSEVFA